MAMCSWHRESKNSVLNVNLVNANRPISITNSDYVHVTCIVTVICFNTHGAIKSSQELVETCLCFPDWIGIWKCWFLRRAENWSTQRKTSRSKGENQQQTQSTYGINTRIWITTLVWQASALTTAPPWFNFKWWKWDFQSPRLPRDNSIIPFLAAPGFLRIYELPAEDEWTTDNLDFLKVLEFFFWWPRWSSSCSLCSLVRTYGRLTYHKYLPIITTHGKLWERVLLIGQARFIFWCPELKVKCEIG